MLWIARVWGPDGRLKELAAATGIPRSTIHYMVAGKRGVTAESALRLAKALGTTPEHWLAIANQDALATARPALAKSLARIRCVLSEEGK